MTDDERTALLGRILANSIIERSGCWRWKGARTTKGYASVSVGGRSFHAHRVAYECVRPIPDGWEVHHLCTNRGYVCPGHLVAMSPADHARHHAPEGAPCRLGHPRKRKRDGRWWCPQCHNETNRGWRQRAADRAGQRSPTQPATLRQ